jgi:hypothetical protein
MAAPTREGLITAPLWSSRQHTAALHFPVVHEPRISALTDPVPRKWACNRTISAQATALMAQNLPKPTNIEDSHFRQSVKQLVPDTVFWYPSIRVTPHPFAWVSFTFRGPSFQKYLTQFIVDFADLDSVHLDPRTEYHCLHWHCPVCSESSIHFFFFNIPHLTDYHNERPNLR